MKKLRPGEMVQIKTVEELLGVVNEESAMDIEIYKICSFQGHPFKVVDDDKMLELVESIKANGVLSPVLIRPCGNDLYEMISGHRRLHAAKLAGLTAIPSIIREMTDDEATIAMVDANIQREELLPSEKAWAYKMKLDAMKRQGERTDLVLSDEMYKEFDLLTIINENNESAYQVSDELFQLLNVLYKNRKNQEKLEKYIKKNAKALIKEIEEFLNEDTCSFDILTVIKDSICDGLSMGWFEELGRFLKFQKSFKLKKELDDNEILYELTRNPITGKISAFVNSYTVYEYVNKILGDKYIKNSGVVNSLWFGVPQERRRFIMIGINKDFIKEPSVDMPVDQNFPIITVGEAIMDLMPYQTSDTVTEGDVQEYKESGNISEYAKLMRLDSVGVKNHIVPKTREKSLERFAALQEGENFHKLSTELKDNYADPSRTQNSIYLRLDSTKPSGTVINVRKSMWIHPQLNRAISVREAARLQSFPDKFIFKGPKDAQYQQIGNAVPPLMAKGIAEHLLKYI